jgi:hypothetical protein
MVSSNVTGYMPDSVYTIPNSATNDAAQIEVLECGAVIIVNVAGERLVLTRFPVGTGWSGSLSLEGYHSDFSFVRAGPRLMTGRLVTAMDGGTLKTEMRLVVTQGRAPVMTGCPQAPEPRPAAARAVSTAIMALEAVLSEMPLPHGADISDFVAEGVIDNAGTQRVFVLLSEGGEILTRKVPTLTADQICGSEVLTRDAPKYMLTFKFNQFDDATNVFIQRVEIETGKIVEQHEVVDAGKNEAALTTLFAQALSQLDNPPTRLSTGGP